MWDEGEVYCLYNLNERREGGEGEVGGTDPDVRGEGGVRCGGEGGAGELRYGVQGAGGAGRAALRDKEAVEQRREAAAGGVPDNCAARYPVIDSEITLLKQIDHPNIIRLKEIILSRPNKRNLHRGSTFLVFEYMDHDFAGLFKMKRRFELPEIKCIFRQLLDGVAYLHARKILHRDIKSANILLNDDGQVKLADFGLGRKVRQENVFTYKVVTLWYRAPELLWGSKHYTDKVDVWSLGCVVVEFFTGEVLFRSNTPPIQRTPKAHKWNAYMRSAETSRQMT